MTDPYQIKTFEDALNELQEFTYTNKQAHTLYREYEAAVKTQASKDLLAYIKLKIVTFILNDKWSPGKNNDARYGIYMTTPPHLDMTTSRMFVPVEVGYWKFDMHAVYLEPLLSPAIPRQLSFKNMDLAKHAFIYFKDLYADYFVGEF